MKHNLFINPKGGVGKSTTCEYTAHELVRLGFSVSVDNTDQQRHVITRNTDNADFCLYDTAGAFDGETLELLQAAKDVDARIIIVITTGFNDFQELPFVVKTLEREGVLDKAIVVFTKVNRASKAYKDRRAQVEAMGLPVAKWSMPLLEDFNQRRFTTRTTNEISAFINEVIL